MNGSLRHIFRVTSLVLLALAVPSAADPGRLRAVGERAALNSAVPAGHDVYRVNGRVRPLLLFWIGRDNVGEARITRTRVAPGHETIELLIGSDPMRAPRRINRWGYVREEVTSDGATLLGVMRASDEKTLAEAEAVVAREGTAATVFKAMRTTIRGQQAVSGTMHIETPATFTFRDLDAILERLPDRANAYTTTELPAGTMPGFMAAVDDLMRESVDACARPAPSARSRVKPRSYFYNHTLYDLSLVSCHYEEELRTKMFVYPKVVEGRFVIRNRTTHEETRFQITFGTAGAFLARPVRAVFRPHWWIELELLLELEAGGSRAR